jgi:hypothetical protein
MIELASSDAKALAYFATSSERKLKCFIAMIPSVNDISLSSLIVSLV